VAQESVEALGRGRAAGAVPAGLNPDRGARIVMALLHGFIVQRTAFGLHDTAGFTRDVRAVLSDAGILSDRPSASVRPAPKEPSP
jgi:hypothetical protein